MNDAAFLRGTFWKAPTQRPEPGRPLDPVFYQELLGAFDGLVAEGWRDPAAEFARRMDENPATVRSWLRRGRKYLSSAKNG
jgi:hypothetical protein